MIVTDPAPFSFDSISSTAYDNRYGGMYGSGWGNNMYSPYNMGRYGNGMYGGMGGYDNMYERQMYGGNGGRGYMSSNQPGGGMGMYNNVNGMRMMA